ncbi:PREDICTED: protein asteroid homolog 1-like [Amphimedon queenslandica]|uniref:Asteroid domain-containing protein n=1 Tax=Amphimedon queenslandica TaxID=400682 RepID=A0A1X7VPL1_AMPQE|nr:PREDICTED: protein asteroid homolog 1-like [Amphimedon queenslandica]|eukprot:XP_011409194.1 PREDICTED: protein asteroid homolog 1-like [Amphimedon queenslandica]
MGIKGLTNYVEVTFQKWKRVEIRNCPIVLDGSSIPYHMHGDFDWKFGGNYPAFRDAIEAFFDTLIGRGISPIHVVFDGAKPAEKQNALRTRRQGFQHTIRKSLEKGEVISEPDERNIRPPLTTETLRKVMEKYKSKVEIILYAADEDVAKVAVSLARKHTCYLVGQSSDFYIYGLPKGYIPFSKLEWRGPGFAVWGKIFRRDVFMKALGLEHDLIYAIPAIAGNDTLPNLLETCPLFLAAIKEHRDSQKGIRLVMDFLHHKGSTMEKLIRFLENVIEDDEDEAMEGKVDTEPVVETFINNLEKANVMYKDTTPFDEHKFSESIAHQSIHKEKVPAWIVDNYKNFLFSSSLLEVFVYGRNFLRVVPDDCSQCTSTLFSNSIRREIYSILVGKERKVEIIEVIRQVHSLLETAIKVPANPSHAVKIEDMVSEETEMRRNRIYAALQCDGKTLDTINEKWYLPISSIIFWAKKAKLPPDDIRLKALILCFAKCFHKSLPAAQHTPAFNLRTLHLYAQWQCVYHDAILLNQVLALPLPYLSPADLFDGKLVTYYSQKNAREFDMLTAELDDENQHLYKNIFEIVNKNMPLPPQPIAS